MILTPSALLRKALLTDAVGCGAFAVGALVVLTGPQGWRAQLDVHPPLLVATGLLAMLGVLLFPSLARRRRVSSLSVGVVIATNAAWAALCCGAVALDWIDATPIGDGIIVAQALAAGLVAVLEWVGLRAA